MNKTEIEKSGGEGSYSVITNNGIFEKAGSKDIISLFREYENELELLLGYDIHAGFNVPDNNHLRKILGEFPDVNFSIEPSFVDENKQYGKKPFSPTQVYVKNSNGEEIRRKVARSSSAYVSQLEADLERIEEAYQNLLPNGSYPEISQILREAKNNPPESLGEFLRGLHEQLFKKQVGGLPNVEISSFQFDKYDPETGRTTHGPEVHSEQDILIIGQSKKGTDKYVMDKFSRARKKGILGRKPGHVIISEDPDPYFWR